MLGEDPRPTSPASSHIRSSRYGPVCLLALLAVGDLAIRLINLPLNRIIEMRYCFDYYLKHDPSVIDPDGHIPELICKVSEVQKKVAWLESAMSISLIVSGTYVES